MSLHNIKLVCGFEVRQRLRTTRWKLSLLAWIIFLAIIIYLLYIATENVSGHGNRLISITNILLMLVIGLGSLVAPTLGATSINGDRDRQTLALVQVTPLSTWELLLGKFFAAWFAGTIIVITTLPIVILTSIVTNNWLSYLLSLLVVELFLGAITAVGIAFSAFISRPAASISLTTLVVALLAGGTPILFGLATHFCRTEVSSYHIDITTNPPDDNHVSWLAPDQNGAQTHYHFDSESSKQPVYCHEYLYINYKYPYEEFTWLLRLNPVVQLSDALPIKENQIPFQKNDLKSFSQASPTAYVMLGMQELDNPRSNEIPNYIEDICIPVPAEVKIAPELKKTLQNRNSVKSQTTEYTERTPEDGKLFTLQPNQIWTRYTLGLFILSMSFLYLANKRLQVPIKKLIKGTRIS